MPAQFTVVTLLGHSPQAKVRGVLPAQRPIFEKSWYLMPILTTMLSLRHLRNLNGRKKIGHAVIYPPQKVDQPRFERETSSKDVRRKRHTPRPQALYNVYPLVCSASK